MNAASRLDSSVPLTHHDPRDLGLTCLVKKCKIRFQILSGFVLDFLKETRPATDRRDFTKNLRPQGHDRFFTFPGQPCKAQVTQAPLGIVNMTLRNSVITRALMGI